MELLVENENVYAIELPGVVGAQLIITNQQEPRPLPHADLQRILGGDQRLQRFGGKSVGLYTGKIVLWYGTEEPDLADILNRIGTPNPERLRRQMKYLYEKKKSLQIRHLYLFGKLVGQLKSITIPLQGIIAARRLSRTEGGSREGHLCISNNEVTGKQYLHYGQDGTLLFVQMPTLKEPGLALLLSERVVNTIIASYALTLVGPHRKWLEDLAKPAP